MKRKVLLFSILLAVAFSLPCLAMNPYRKAFIFFAVVRDGDIIAVQSNTIAIADDSESDSYTLTLSGVNTEPGGGGSPVPGFTWEGGSSYGGLSSEGRLRAENVPIGYWESNSTLYCRFELRDSSAVLINSWDTPLFLRTIEHISFFFIKNGEGISQTIPGELPFSSPNYNYTGFSWSTVNFGGLAGATVSYEHSDNGRTTGLEVSGNPVSGWAQNDAPFDLYITSESDNPDNVCVAEFRGLSWEGLEIPYQAAQPTVTLRRLESGGTDLVGYYWIRGQFDGAAAINSTLPSGATAKGILQDAPLSGSEFTLDDNCVLTGLNFSPTYPSSNNFIVHIESDINEFLAADSKELPIQFRDFDVDYSTLADWCFPYAESPTSVTEANRTLAIIGGDLFDWSGLSSDFDSGSSFSIEGSAYGKQGIPLTWPYGGLVDGDSGSINVTLQSYESGYPGWPSSTVNLGVFISSDFDPPDTSIISGPTSTVTTDDVQFTFTGTDDTTPVLDLQYSFWLENHEANWSDYGSAISKIYNDLPNGSYTFYVRAKDLSGNIDPTPASSTFTVDCALPDTDGDGLPDDIEANFCTQYNNPDTDEDGLVDGIEDINHNGQINTGETNPCDADTDDDGLSDGIEDADQNGVVDDDETDPCALDTDGDGIQDGTELGYTLTDVEPDTNTHIFQPDVDPSTTTDPILSDSDGDGVSDGDEDLNQNGRIDQGETDPNDAQSFSNDSSSDNEGEEGCFIDTLGP